MLFNSVQFAIFFVIVYSLYLVFNHKRQNRMLLLASCIFYGAWDWRFLFLMFISICTDYFCSLNIDKSDSRPVRRRFLAISIVVNLSILGFFKYFNFFADTMQIFLNKFGIPVHMATLRIILPVGISFYTFQTMSYSCDVYRRELEPTKNFLDYALFVTYFPQLVAGPIMRAKDLLPQVLANRKVTLDKFYGGCHLILWGLFQKVFVADNLAKLVEPVFSSAPPYNGIAVLLALYAFAFQIFCDFAGYSNIARGLGKCMGFEIMINFNLPYFATNPSEFWRRWHISLSTWLRDYLYIPLGGNRKGTFATYRNLFLTMLLGGLWHGAAWTFVFWGIYQGMLLVIHRLLKPFLSIMPPLKGFFIGKIWFFVRVIFFFHLICIGWLLFRAQSMTQVYHMLHSLLFNFRFDYGIGINDMIIKTVLYSSILLIVQLMQYWKDDLMAIYKWRPAYVAAFHAIIFYLITMYSSGGAEFIYFQF